MIVGVPSRTRRRELLDVAIDRLGRPQRKHDVGFDFVGVARHRRSIAELRRSAASVHRRRLEQLVARRRVLAAAAREVDVVLRVVPGPPELGLDVRAARDDDERVGRKERQDRAALEARRRLRCTLPVDRQHERVVDGAASSAATRDRSGGDRRSRRPRTRRARARPCRTSRRRRCRREC